MHLVGSAGIELQVACQRHRIGAALLERLAHVERFEPGQLVGLAEHGVAHGHQDAATLGRAESTPRAIECCLRRADCGVDIGRATARDLGQDSAVGRVVQRQSLAAGASAPLSADEHLGGVER